MKRKLSFSSFVLSALLLVLSPSCTKDVNSDAAPGSLAANAVFKKDKSDVLKSVKQATSRFHSTTQAHKAGYVGDEHCVSVPGLGGMGYHWVNSSLIDPIFDPQKPEAILYATGPDGKLQIVGLEYIVIDIGQPDPMFGDQPFDVGGVPPLEANSVPHWSLHVWLYKDNPAGMFKPFNPTVTCP